MLDIPTGAIDDQAEERPRRKPVTFNLPPCEERFLIHYRDGEPIGLLIDDQPYAVRKIKRSTGFGKADALLILVEGRTVV